jgi:deoxyribonuclease-4
MPILGAHMSIAGGYYRAVDIAHQSRCDCVQLFTKNNNQWRAKPIGPEDVERFQGALAQHGIGHPTSHTSYLINLAAPDSTLWIRSIDAMVAEVQRAEVLGIPRLVVHPGAYTSSSEEQGIERVARALDEVHRQTPEVGCQILLETTAGQGSSLGCRFEHLADILARCQDPDRLAVCFDTCHVFAAGYPLATRREYLQTLRTFDRLIGLDRIRAFHLNDSKRPLGSRVDRHEHIGRGEIGADAFRWLLNDRRFRKMPMYLETPKGLHRGKSWDVINLTFLRSLVAGKAPATHKGSP